MNIKFNSLSLQCRQSRELIKFSSHITYFHGMIGAGKSSIVRLIDFCLGGDYERTPALEQELVSVQLSLNIGNFDVLLEREAKGSNQIQVTWINKEGNKGSVLAPISASRKGPVWEGDVYNFSDLMFYLNGIQPIKIRRSKRDPESPMIRLSFRDIMWYCYLRQEYIDSSFYRLEEPFVKEKSQAAMKYIVGAYSEKISDLENQLYKTQDIRYGKIQAAKQIIEFLKQFGFSSEEEINSSIQSIDSQIENYHYKLNNIREENKPVIHYVDELSNKLTALRSKIESTERLIYDIKNKINKQESLKAEFLSSKFKFAKSETAALLLTEVLFDKCPSCGSIISNITDNNVCPLCKSIKSIDIKENIQELEIFRKDLDNKINEIEEMTDFHKTSLNVHEIILQELKEEKNILDLRFEEETKQYDSIYLSKAREIEREIARLEERKRGFIKNLEMPKAIHNLENESDLLIIEEERLKRDIKNELDKLNFSEEIIRELESEFLNILLSISFPGVNINDKIHIDRNSWIVNILTNEGQIEVNFYELGSGGKKTLYNVCYALSIHKIATKYNLPLPSFLIIDTPMKNIGEEINIEIFENFYNYLYHLAETDLINTQFIIIDKKFYKPKSKNIVLIERYMTTDDEKYPPLISYYRGN